MFHLNARSLASNFHTVQDYLQTLNHKFDAYAFKFGLINMSRRGRYNMPDYKLVNKARERRGGGCCMYLQNDLNFEIRSDLYFDIDSIIDTLFVEIEQTSSKNIIIGVIYKAPNTGADEFIDLIHSCLSKVVRENKPCYLLGDFNFDFLKYVMVIRIDFLMYLTHSALDLK